MPSAVRDDALRDFDKAVHAERAKARKAKKSKKQHRPAKFRFRSRKDSQCIEIQHRDWGRKRGMFAALFAPGAMRSSEPLPDKVQCAVRVTLDRLGRLHVCYPVRVRGDNQAPGGDRARQKLTTDEDGRHVIHVPQPKRGARNHSVIALDPGVRTFMTCYDADGAVVEWGRGDMRRICALCRFADKLQGRIKTLKGPRHKARRRRMRRAWLRILETVRNRVNEAHRKFAKWLCTSYRVVLLPKFETSRMCTGPRRKINNKVVRGMMTWAHYRFRQTLLAKAELYPACRVIVCDEAYTSKTCGQCGAINRKLGGSKVFRCKPCGYTADRDASAARNILLRYLTLHGVRL